MNGQIEQPGTDHASSGTGYGPSAAADSRMPWQETRRVLGLWIEAARQAWADWQARRRAGSAFPGIGGGITGHAGQRRLYRSRHDRFVSGVCGGLAAYTGLPAAVVRIFFVLIGLAGIVPAVLLYTLLAILVPMEPADIESVSH